MRVNSFVFFEGEKIFKLNQVFFEIYFCTLTGNIRMQYPTYTKKKNVSIQVFKCGSIIIAFSFSFSLKDDQNIIIAFSATSSLNFAKLWNEGCSSVFGLPPSSSASLLEICHLSQYPHFLVKGCLVHRLTLTMNPQ